MPLTIVEVVRIEGFLFKSALINSLRERRLHYFLHRIELINAGVPQDTKFLL